MGLDMYLNKRVYLGWQFEHRREELGRSLPDWSEYGIDTKRVIEVIQEEIYWRKANAIHAWFVRNVQNGEDDCKDYYVSSDDLHKLYTDVCTVLNSTDLAEEILPTQGGFFFGSTDYDEGYWEDMKYTKKELEALFERYPDDEGDYSYNSSW